MWIARDLDGSLYLYKEEPMPCDGEYYYVEDTNYIELDKNLFPELNFEDGPKQIKLVLTICENAQPRQVTHDTETEEMKEHLEWE